MKIILWHLLYLVFFYYAFADEQSEEFIEVYMTCQDDSLMLSGFESSSPFFRGAVVTRCSIPIEDAVCIKCETSHTYTSPDEGLTLDAECPDETQIIRSINMTVSDAHVHSITITCNSLYVRSKEDYKLSSVDLHDSVADCGEYAGIRKISFSDAEDGMATSVECVTLL